jgi:2-polyprenyl-3-methyl-5-hydroxy-6-metoxy-1,4-benzoquinol methylase
MSSATDYQYFNSEAPHTQQYLIRPLLKCLQQGRHEAILDIGCGNGNMAGKLLNMGYNVFGIDTSCSGIALAQRNISPDRFFLSDAESDMLPKELEDVNFDVIISTEVIEHLYSPLKYIHLCKEILEKGKGRLIISTPYHGYLKNLLLAVSGKMDSHFTVDWEGGHIKFFSRKTLTKLLEDNGFKVLKFYGAGRVPFLWKSMIVMAEIR